jgi:hypothetical protein
MFRKILLWRVRRRRVCPKLIERYENRCLLEAINAAYDELPGPEEEIGRQNMRSYHRRMVEGEW